MFQIRLRWKLLVSKLALRRVAQETTKQVSTGGIIGPLISFFFKTVILLFFTMAVIFPFYYMFSVALMTKDETQLPDTKLSPDIPQWHNFSDAFSNGGAGYWDAVLITASVTAASIVLKIVITMLMGYAFSLRNWRFKKIVWTGFLALLMIPEVALLFGQYQVVVDLNLRVGPNVVMAMILPFIASVFSAFMFKNAFEVIPDRTKEAAYVDGTSPIKYFLRIAVPMVTPTTWTVAILTGFAAWNSYMWPALLLAGTDKDVITTWLFKTGIDSSSSDGRVQQNIRMAAAILAITPMFIVYFGFRSRIMRAISRQGSAIKG